ncbi:MAG: hypothetical protein IKT99_07430 [Oscillospiraceae bacterium]|nr:hypothetical protein [Oscillospiraceae bacterium]
MQDKYVGDIGDFGKLGLLRCLAKTGLTIGVNWYHTLNDNNNKQKDGKYTEYLTRDDYKEKELFQRCDCSLWKELKRIVESHHRQISSLENSGLIDAVFWSMELDFSGQTPSKRVETRNQWHNDALQKLKDQDIVFVDPDNGLIVPSAEHTRRSNKYVLPEELKDYYASDSSVIFYQHKARKSDDEYREVFLNLLQTVSFPGASGLCFKFKKTSMRYYFFIIQPKHKLLIESCIKEMMESPWNSLFEELELT